MKKIAYVLLFSLIIILSGCRVTSSQFRTPEKQFVFVKENVSISVCHKEMGICIPTQRGHGYASGVLVSHSVKEDRSYYLTAGHVCSDILPSARPELVTKIEREIHLLDYDGDNNIAEVVAIDNKHDLCLLSAERVKHPPTVVEKGKLKKHIKVINVAAPAGIWDRDMMLHFEGEYQGDRQSQVNRPIQAVYTITAQPGSSGSPIYNPVTGRLIGIITEVLSPSYDVAFGPTLKQINEFLDENLPS